MYITLYYYYEVMVHQILIDLLYTYFYDFSDLTLFPPYRINHPTDFNGSC